MVVKVTHHQNGQYFVGQAWDHKVGLSAEIRENLVGVPSGPQADTVDLFQRSSGEHYTIWEGGEPRLWDCLHSNCCGGSIRVKDNVSDT